MSISCQGYSTSYYEDSVSEVTTRRHEHALAGLPIKLFFGAAHFLQPIQPIVGEKQLYYSQSRTASDAAGALVLR